MSRVKSWHLRPLFLAVAVTVIIFVPVAASASNWVNGLGVGSKGQAQARDLPSTPTGVSAACTSPLGKTIQVTWDAVSTATTYTVYRSTTSATAGFTVAASGVTATSWTSGTLSNGTYWFQVAAYIGSNWKSPNSPAPASRRVSVTGCS